MNFYAHTAEDERGQPLPQAKWQLLKDHLRADHRTAAPPS